MPKLIYFGGFIVIGAALIGGQLLRLSLGGITVTALDLAVLGWAAVWLLDLLIHLRRYPLPRFGWWAGLFMVLAIVALIGAGRWIGVREIMISATYLLRWVAYGLLVFMGYHLAKSSRPVNVLGLIFGLVAIIGISQWLILPDLSWLERLGWDPHQGRLVSTFLDPNFVGGFLVVGLALALPQLLTRGRAAQRWYWGVLTSLMLVGIYLTFSRSALLALIVAAFIIGALRYRWVALGLMLVLVAAYLASPKLQERVKGAFTLDQTARYRIASWQEGWNIIKHEPIIGVGFNTLPYTRPQYGYWPAGHAASGFDSSLLTVGATTGGLGLLAYLGILVSAVLLAWRKWRAKAAPIALTFLAATGALLVHSLFVNSLLYPSVLVVWWIILGLVWAI